MIRTDLALEAANLSGESDLPGIEIRRTKKHGLTLTTVTVLDETGSRAIGKPPGRYITLETDPIGETALTGSEEAALLGESLGALLPSEGTLLVACLGNAAITPDALGPRAAAGYWQPAMWQAGNSCSGSSVRWQCWRRESSDRPALRPPALSAPWQGRSALRRCLPSMLWLPGISPGWDAPSRSPTAASPPRRRGQRPG